MTIEQALFCFLLYSFGGWCVEVAYQAVRYHKVINRGFLNGPVCPLYGFGVVGMLLVVEAASGWTSAGEELPLPLLLLLGIFLATALELIGGFALDKLFHARWWDYTDMRYNFHGYICPRFSLIWGLAIVFVVRVLHPYISGIASRVLTGEALRWMMGISCALYLFDLIVSVCVVLKLNRELEELDRISSSIRRISNSLTMVVGEGAFLAQDAVIEGKHRAGALGLSLDLKAALGKIPSGPPMPEADESEKLAHLLETRDEFNKKKADALLAVGEKSGAVRAKASGALDRAQAARDLALDKAQAARDLALDKAQAARDLALDKAQAARDLALDKAQDTLASLIRQRDAWFERFRRGRHFTLRRVMRFYPHFRHLKYDALLQEIKALWDSEEKKGRD